MNISEIERRLIELDNSLHSILELIRKAKRPGEDIVEEAAGAWGYDVNGVDFVRGLRRTERV